MNLDILPRVIQDSYVDDIEEALEEVEKRRASPVAVDAVTRIIESPYGGFRVFTVSRSLAIEIFTGLAEEGMLPTAYPTRKTAFR